MCGIRSATQYLTEECNFFQEILPALELDLAALLEGEAGADNFKLADVTSSTIKGGAGDDLVSATGLVSKGLIYGNSGADTLEIVGAVTSTSAYGGAGKDSLTIGGAAKPSF